MDNWERGVIRFWDNVNKDTDSGCWEWTKCVNHDGYGQITIDYKDYRTHRLAWLLCNGYLPDDAIVCHKCDNRLCCNPSHLFLGTQKDNIYDMIDKGRHDNMKLSLSIANEIRSLYNGGLNMTQLSKRFNVTIPNVSAIIHNKTWVNPDYVPEVRKNKGRSKITKQQADEIRMMKRAGLKAVDIAAKYGVNYRTVYDICSGRSWTK